MHRHDGFRELDRQECLRLPAQVPLGRVVHTEDALPAVLPVDFFLDHDQAVDSSVVAFEADSFDEATHTGWSVVVTGRAATVDDPGEKERLGLSGPVSWAPIENGVLVRIEPEPVTGRVLEEVTTARRGSA